MRLSGEVALVTGAGRGIGAETARVLAAEGAAVAVTARGLAAAERVAEAIMRSGGRAIAVALDVGEAHSVEHAVAAVTRDLGAPTILVNNAGVIAPIGRLADVAPAEWAAAIHVNLAGAAFMARAVLKPMLAAGRGTIVNVSSGAAHRPLEGWSAYCAAKAGLAMLTRSIALEYGEAGIRAIGFAPGIVDTDMQAAIRASGIGPLASLPREKLGNVTDPAKAIAFLCSAGGAAHAGQEVDIRAPEFRTAAGLAPPG